MKKIQYLMMTIFAAAFFMQTAFVMPTAAQNTKEAERQRVGKIMSSNANIEEFRSEYDSYLVEMQEVVNQLKGNAAFNKKLEQGGFDSTQSIGYARQSLAEMSADDLVKMREIYARFPQWRESVGSLRKIAAPALKEKYRNGSLTTKNGSLTTNALISDSCPDESIVPSITDLAVLEGVLILADGIMEAFPTDGFTIAARLIPIAAVTLAKEGFLAAQTIRNLHDDCTSPSKDDLNDAKDEIITNSDSNKSDIIDNVNTNTTTLQTDISHAKTDIVKNDNTNKDTIVTNDNKNKDTIVTNDNANTLALTNLINASTTRIINNDNDNKNELKNLVLRTQIEADLSSTDGSTFVALYETPSNICLPSLNDKGLSQIGALSNPVQCGLLDLVRSIVRDTIASVGAGTNAQKFFAEGDANRTAGKYKAAYTSYRQAYKAASK